MISEDNYYKKVGNLILSDYQIEILNKKGVDLNKFSSNHELIYYLESILNNTVDEELESVSLELSEMYYYNDVNK
ncbi:MAG: hypothetical protein IJ094_06205 [Bacilli bacterium]|nr:hypothetical protein [Bacilli bacterium]